MKRIMAIAAVVFALVLSFALVGCSGASKDPAANFVGSWKVVGMSDTTEDDIALMEALGMNIVLELDEDEKASINMMGEKMEGTWKAKSATECSVTIDGDTMDATLDGEELKFSADGQDMTFKKLTEEEAKSLADGSSE